MRKLGQRTVKILFATVLVTGAVNTFIPIASAHHSSAPHFDMSKSITVEGTITEFQFVNPHGYVFFTVADPSGGKPIPWRCELESRTALERRGWKQAIFTPGHKITFKGAPARREANACVLQSFISEDGIEHLTNEDYAKGTNPRAVLSPKGTAPRPARLPNGRPNLAGLWLGVGVTNGDQPNSFFGVAAIEKAAKGKGPGNGAEPTPAGALAAKKYDLRYDDPGLKCIPANIFFAWIRDRLVNEVVETNDTVTLKYGYMNLVRTIYLNTPAHPKDIKTSIAGHSIGRWEGDVLVVDTIGFKPGVLVPLTGLQHSAQMHVVERFTLDNTTQTLTHAFRADDPLYLKTPYMGLDVMKVSDEPFTEYNCVELSGKNNLRPTGK